VGVGEEDFLSVKSLHTCDFLEDPSIAFQDMNLEEVEMAGIANPGPLDREKGIIYPPNIDKEKVKIRDLFGNYLDEFFLINDCTAGVVGEYVYGDDPPPDMVYVTISTGIGGGVITDGRSLEGSCGNFAEIGHLVVGGERKCSCGGEGHWESYCSGANLPEFAEEITSEDFENTHSVFDAYDKGDEGAEKVIALMRSYNAKGIANLINAYDPELVVFGGSVALNNFGVVVEGLEEEIQKEVLSRLPEMRPASLGERSVLYGLLAICRQEGPCTSIAGLK